MQQERSENLPALVECLITPQAIFDAQFKISAYLLKVGPLCDYYEKDDSQSLQAQQFNFALSFQQDSLPHIHNTLISTSIDISLLEHIHLNEQSVVLLDMPSVKSSELAQCQKLARHGVKFAFDNFELVDGWEKLADIAQFVCIDIKSQTDADCKLLSEQLTPFDLHRIAKEVDNYQAFQHCLELGFDRFHGQFFATPKLSDKEKSTTNKIVVLKLLAELSRPDVLITDIEKMFSADPKLSVNLLKLINSSSFIKSAQIDSLRQAIVYLGLQKLKEWVSVLILQSTKMRTSELLISTLIRAKMAETLAGYKKADNQPQCFTAGLFSHLDAMFDLPMDVVLAELNLSDDLNQALLQHTGPVGETLLDVMLYLNGDWNALGKSCSTSQYYQAYRTSLSWAYEMLKAFD